MRSQMAASSLLQSSMTPLLSLEMVCPAAALRIFKYLACVAQRDMNASASGFSLPEDPDFWFELFEEAKSWGLMT